MTEDLASSFYEEHKNKFFYNRLVTFMCRLVVFNVKFKFVDLHAYDKGNLSNLQVHVSYYTYFEKRLMYVITSFPCLSFGEFLRN